MSDEETAKTDAPARDSIAEIFERAISETLKRLISITAEEREDNMAFDRAARTALAFLRIAESAATLAAGKRKEQTDHDQTGADAEHAARLKRDEEVLKRQLNAHIDRLRGRRAEGACRGDGANDRESRGDGI